MSKERLEECERMKLFLGLVDSGEFIYKDGNFYRRLKLTGKLKQLGTNNTGGYRQLTKTINGVEYNILEHRLVYCHFNKMDLFPSNKTINHKNGIKTDNRIENLEMVSQSDNLVHAYKNGLRSAKKGENNPSSKLTEKDIRKIIGLFGEKSVKELSDEYGVSTTVLYRIKSNESWKHIAREALEEPE